MIHLLAPGLRHVAVAMAIWASAGPVHATGPSESSERRLPVRVEIGTDGSVTSAVATREVPEPLRDLVERAAARAVFAPAKVDGRAVPASAWLTAVTRLDFDDEGDVTATVAQIVGGGVPATAGTWPTPSVRGANGYGAQVSVLAVFDAEGRADPAASRVGLHDLWRDDGVPVSDEQRTRRGAAFLQAAREGLKRWRWTPETVAGKPLPGEFAITLTFAAMNERMRRGWTPPARPPTTYRPLPPAGVEPATLVSWTARTAKSPPPTPAARLD